MTARPARRPGGLTPPAVAEPCRHSPAGRLLLPGVDGWICGRCCRVFYGRREDAAPQKLPAWSLAIRAARQWP